MKVKDLEGAALDWAVAKSMNLPPPYFDEDGRAAEFSSNWAQGGPIIERERIDLQGDGDGGWIACDNLNPEQAGPTPLIAAMRCFVASKLGDEVEVPDEVKEAQHFHDFDGKTFGEEG